MNISDIITVQRTLIVDAATDKQQVLDTLSDVLDTATTAVSRGDIVNALVNREKLGSTGIGEGAAIPHGRMKGLENCVGAMLRVRPGVDFDAPDDQPVDLVFGLLVPQESTQAHLDILRTIAEMLAQADCVDSLRNADDSQTLYDQLLAHSIEPQVS